MAESRWAAASADEQAAPEAEAPKPTDDSLTADHIGGALVADVAEALDDAPPPKQTSDWQTAGWIKTARVEDILRAAGITDEGD